MYTPSGTENDGQSSAPRAWAAPAPHLFVVLEGERPTAGSLRCALRGIDEVRIGRAERRAVEREPGGTRLALGIPDPKMSTRHARVIRGPKGWTFEDLGSTNGSWTNGARIATHPIVDGDTIQVGRTFLRVRLALPTPEECVTLEERADDRLGLSTVVPALASELAIVTRAASSKVPVLLLGETGTGKEVAARAIHELSGRAGSFVAVNCAALPEALVEAQLFGHVRGAFSGAARDELGLVRSAAGGTLFLDEIGDLPRAVQGVLLRVLQEGEVVPIGATRPVPVDVRVVAATHRPIDEMVARGEFRQDLLARLRGFVHRLWPLRERREDLGLLVATLLQREARAELVQLSGPAALALVRHDWPLNIRELAQALEHARVLAGGGPIELEHLPAGLSDPGRASLPAPPPAAAATATAALTEADAELRAELSRHLGEASGNVAAVARAMNKAPMQVYRWMRKLGLDPKAFR
jgi:transcriptional regulator with GAF, ATPase, and Fis domain